MVGSFRVRYKITMYGICIHCFDNIFPETFTHAIGRNKLHVKYDVIYTYLPANIEQSLSSSPVYYIPISSQSNYVKYEIFCYMMELSMELIIANLTAILFQFVSYFSKRFEFPFNTIKVIL